MPQSVHSSLNSRHTSNPAHRRNRSYARRPPLTDDDAYSFALRVAYLAYLLQPRPRRVANLANTSKPIHRASSSINDMVKDLGHIRDSKSTRFPHGFLAELDKRITGVLIGKEKMPEYNDALIKRTFAAFLNELKNPTFRKSMEKDRRVEDLLLIFFSKATSELQKGKAPDDDSWKLMVDRHVALLVRIIRSTLSQNDWTRDRPELSSRLKTLEAKLLQHDQDLAHSSRTGASGTLGVETEAPRSFEVKDMPLVLVVCRIFARSTAQAQSDIDAHRDVWTERAALRDLKQYQSHMTFPSRITLSREDFDADEAFELWRKGETNDTGQMMLSILQSDPALARSGLVDGGSVAKKVPPLEYIENSTQSPRQSGDGYPGGDVENQIDLAELSLDKTISHGSTDVQEGSLTFMPPDPKACHRHILKTALASDLPPDAQESSPQQLVSESSMDLLNEIAIRWRIPFFTRAVHLLDVTQEKYQRQEVTLNTVDAAFSVLKDPPPPPKKSNAKPPPPPMALFERKRWAVADRSMYQKALNSLHDALLRELYETFQHAYESKPPNIATVMYVLENHLYDDELFDRTPADLDAFSATLSDALRQNARQKYREVLSQNVPDNATEWEFYHVVKLGQGVTALCEKIQKRYRKSPEVMGVKPLAILVEEMLPNFADDARALVRRILELARERDEPVPIQDGFELYRALVEIRGVHAQALQGRPFGFHIESMLQEFVWRWIQTTDAKMLDWIEGAVEHDDFAVHQDPRSREQGLPPADDERHSQSVVDVYRIFRQSIEQVVQLEWDDDLQYARFMTALGKSIGRGVARYCELLETKFGKEMDRQTPEQELAAQRTQRERWLAAARDLYASGGRGGDKIEPFQFWPETFVKLNDVEYALGQLDQVEQEVNVDACAEVIQRLDPPPVPAHLRRRGEGQFTFTIKIIEAEDLRAGDMNGLSDPYVVLGDEYQKRLAKTRIVYQTLNPRWDETVDILTTGPLHVVATVWDWDALGDHDCLGRASLKLDPAHFGDFLPREYWLELDTQGRVLVRVGMEGERDDIQFYFAKAFRALKRTEREMTRRIGDKLSAYIRQCLSRRTLRALVGGGGAGVTISGVKGYLSQVAAGARPTSMPVMTTTGARAADVHDALRPLLTYFDDNFAIMKQTLTESAMVLVMGRLWKEALVTIEGLLVPPLSDKPSSQRPLGQHEVDVVYKWLQVNCLPTVVLLR